jgi:hypothetical protein
MIHDKISKDDKNLTFLTGDYGIIDLFIISISKTGQRQNFCQAFIMLVKKYSEQ